jgi:transcription elongation GreA/GreB family factor
MLKASLMSALEAALATARAAHESAIEGATHAESRPENDKDTRGLEQSYLARGIAQRVADLEAAVVAVAKLPVARVNVGGIGALVTLDDGRRFLIATHGGGLVVDEVTVVTPTSPIGRALIGRRVDDECEVAIGGKARTMTVTDVE